MNRLLSVSLICALVCLCTPLSLFGQAAWEEAYEEWLEEAEDEESTTTWEALHEELEELYAHPLNLNTATREQLERLPFLTAVQAEEILQYLSRYGYMETASELMLVKSLNLRTRRLLTHFIRVERIEKEDTLSWKSLWKRGHHEAIVRTDIPLYQKAGYKSYSDSILTRYPNRRYLGDPLYHSLRYNFKWKDKIHLGFIMEKDAGEPFFSHGTHGYDYTSFYLLLRDFGRLKALAVGNYRLRFGQGLVMNTHFSPGKAATLSALGGNSRGIRPHSSTSENDALYGLAATYRLWKIDATAFYSHHYAEANLDDEKRITSLKTDGLHRTPLEYAKRHNTTVTLVGGNLTYHQAPFHCGLTAVHSHLSRPFAPATQAYKRYYPQGSDFFTLGGDYAYYSYRLTLSGETAFSRGGGFATLNRMQLRLWNDWQMTLLQRYYSRHYHALHARTFSTGSEVRNECGLYAGIEGIPRKRWHLSAYADLCYFPWLKYRASASSYGGEAMIQAIYTNRHEDKTTLRYRCRITERDYTSAGGRKYLATRLHHRLRIQQTYSPSRLITLTTLADYNCIRFMHDFHQGIMLTQRLRWQPHKPPISLTASASYFYTDNYDTRISRYEQGLLYTFSFPSFYGHGIHCSTTAKWDINRLFTALVKISHTLYFNRSTIGTGTELINAPHREDIGIQLRWKI